MKKSIMSVVLAAVMLFGIVGLAAAESVTYDGVVIAPGQQEATNSAEPVDVKASVNPKITLTVDTPDPSQEVLFGAVDPETAYSDVVGLEVKSNKAWDLAVVKGGDSALLGLTTTYEAGFTGVNNKGTWTQNDTYSLFVPYTTDPGDYTATVQYTVTQQ